MLKAMTSLGQLRLAVRLQLTKFLSDLDRSHLRRPTGEPVAVSDPVHNSPSGPSDAASTPSMLNAPDTRTPTVTSTSGIPRQSQTHHHSDPAAANSH